MARSEHVAKLREGTDAWNQWRKQNPRLEPDLSLANLAGANLARANLRRADLVGANLERANLAVADLAVANLAGANLRGAYLAWANFRGTDLGKAEFRGAEIGYTIFGNNDLSKISGLETVVHKGPSTIGIDTVYRSKGKISEVFLRGAGVPDNFIEYMHSLAGQAFEYYSCFISYSNKDKDFADRLYTDLQAEGVRCWFAPHDLPPGTKVHEEIDHAIHLHERLLLILSRDSAKSEWVKTEIKKARQRELAEKRRVLFPIRLISFDALKRWEYVDPDTGRDLAMEIREYYIPDFSDWKKDQDLYQQELKRLLEGLKPQKAKQTKGANAST
jgi:uncharacterized protein YjbI with pentapeptide repeats